MSSGDFDIFKQDHTNEFQKEVENVTRNVNFLTSDIDNYNLAFTNIHTYIF